MLISSRALQVPKGPEQTNQSSLDLHEGSGHASGRVQSRRHAFKLQR